MLHWPRPRTGRVGAAVLTAVLAFTLAEALSGTSGTTTTSADLAVRVAGRALVGTDGNPLRLVGVNRSGSEFKCIQGGTAGARGTGVFDGPTDSASVAAMTAWHVDAVRLPLNEDCWLGINGVDPQWGGAAYRAAIGGYVATLHRAGIRVILDLHWSAPGGFPAMGQQPMPDADHAPAFWRSVATAFRDDPAVIFDLFNEPFLDGSYLQDTTVNPWTCWRSGCALVKYVTEGQSTQPFTWRASGMQSLVDTVRSTGAQQPIMIAGVGWANDLTGWLLYRVSDPAKQLIAAWHSYPNQGCSTNVCWEQYVRPVAAQVPVLIGEIGDSVCGNPGFVGPMLNWADSDAIGYLGWTWNAWDQCDNVLIRSYDGTPTAGFGTAFRNHLQGLPAAVSAGKPASAPSGGSVVTDLIAGASRHPKWVAALLLIAGLAAGFGAGWAFGLSRRG
jgi:endoglucanase